MAFHKKLLKNKHKKTKKNHKNQQMIMKPVKKSLKITNPKS